MTDDHERIQFRCTSCGVLLGAAPQFAGKRGSCPKCAGSVLVPMQSEPDESASPTPSSSTAEKG